MVTRLEPVALFRDEDATIVQFGPLALYKYTVQMTRTHIRYGRELHRRLAREYPTGYGGLIWYPPGSKLGESGMGQDQRNDMLDLLREANNSMRAAAMVIELSGFFAAAVRAAATSMVLLAKPRFSVRYSPNVAEATQWLVEQVGTPPSPPVGEALALLPNLTSLPVRSRS